MKTKFTGRPLQLLQQTSAFMERLDGLQLKTQGASKKAAKLIGEAAGKLAEASDILQKEVERRRLLREKYERDLREGNVLDGP